MTSNCTFCHPFPQVRHWSCGLAVGEETSPRRRHDNSCWPAEGLPSGADCQLLLHEHCTDLPFVSCDTDVMQRK